MRMIAEKLVQFTLGESLTNPNLDVDLVKPQRTRSLASLAFDGSGVAFLYDAASARAEQQRAAPKLPAVAEGSSSAVPPVARAGRIAPNVYVPATGVRPRTLYTGDIRPDTGIVFVMVGGKPGSGYAQLAAAIIDELDQRGLAAEFVADEDFHRAGMDCELCASKNSIAPCRDCLESLETTSFYRAVKLAHDTVYRSARYARDQQGNYPLGA